MKDVDIYSGLSWNEKKREMDLLKLEKEANDKYLADKKLMEQIKANEKIKADNEKLAKEKALEERNKRLFEEKKQIIDEEKERERIKENRKKAAANFNNLPVDDMLLLLNDGDGESMQSIFEKIIAEAFNNYYTNKDVREGMSSLPFFYNTELSEEELQKADDLFPLLWSELAEYEMPFLGYLLGDEWTERDAQMNKLVDNFIIDGYSVFDTINDRMGEKVSPVEIARYQKMFILNEMQEVFSNAKNYKDKGNEEKVKEELEKLTQKIQYKPFYAEKIDGEIRVIIPAEDYTKDNFRIKDWLGKHPEKKDKNYNHEDLEYQLKVVNSLAAAVCNEQHVNSNIYDKYREEIPSGLDRKKYVLREIRACFEVQASYKSSGEGDLVKFNQDLAFIADFEQGDFRRMCRENPHIKQLIDMIAAGPLVDSSSKSQYERYKEMKNDQELSHTLNCYMSLTHAIADLIRINYKRQQYEIEGWEPQKDKQKEFYDAYVNITKNLRNDVNTVKSGYAKLNKYANKNLGDYFGDGAKYDIKTTVDIVTGEMAALARGWNPSDIFLYGVINEVYRKSYAKYKENKYDKRISAMSEECFEIIRKLENATSVVEKRDLIDAFEDFTRKYADQKDILEPLEINILNYDRTKDKFEKEYKESVLKELRAGVSNKDNLAKEMINMQKIALKREEDFHDEIFKEFVSGLSTKDKDELQKALYQQRLEEMVKRGEDAYKDQQKVFERKELGDLRYDKSIYNNVFGQIGLIRAKNDGVAAVDKLFESFDNKLDDNAKKKISDEYKAKVLDHSPSMEQYFDAAQNMDKVAADNNDLGFKIVVAPDGGYNIQYTKSLLEIRKDVYENLDSQIEDLEMQVSKYKSLAKSFLEEPKKSREKNGKSFLHFSYTDDEFVYALRDFVKRDAKATLADYMHDFERIHEAALYKIDRCKADGANVYEAEYDYYKKVEAFANEGLKVFSEERYPDFSRSNPVGLVRNNIEVVKSVWTLSDNNNKWNKVVSNELAERQKTETPVDRFHKALNTPVDRRDYEKDKGYPDDLFFKPSKLIHLNKTIVKAISELYGVKVKPKEFSSLRTLFNDLVNEDDLKKVTDIGVSAVALDLSRLRRRLDDYLKVEDNSEYGYLNRELAEYIDKEILTEAHIKQFEKFVENNQEMQKEMAEKKKAWEILKEKQDKEAAIMEEELDKEEKLEEQKKIEDENKLKEQKKLEEENKLEEQKEQKQSANDNIIIVDNDDINNTIINNNNIDNNINFIPKIVINAEDVLKLDTNNNQNVNNGHDHIHEFIKKHEEEQKNDKDKDIDPELVKTFVKHVNSLSVVFKTVLEELTSVREELKNNKKNKKSDNYLTDGSDEYKDMAAKLDNCIKCLQNNDKTPAKVSSALWELGVSSRKYYRERFGLMGLPVHGYGRKRLEISKNLGTETARMYLAVNTIAANISHTLPKESFNYQEAKWEDMKNKALKLGNIHNISHEDREREQSYEDSMKISSAKIEMFFKVKDISKTMNNNYKAGKNIDEYLAMKKNMSYSDKVKYYTLCRQLNKIVRRDVSVTEAEQLNLKFNDNYKRETELKLKNPVCRQILGSGKATAFSDWDKIENNADKLREIYATRLSQIQTQNVSLENAVNNAAYDKQGEQKISASCKKCAEIVILQILSDDKGRSLLYGMGLDENPDNNTYNELVKQTADYFKNKGTFNLKEGEELGAKASRVINDAKTRTKVLKNIAENEKRKLENANKKAAVKKNVEPVKKK